MPEKTEKKGKLQKSPYITDKRVGFIRIFEFWMKILAIT